MKHQLKCLSKTRAYVADFFYFALLCFCFTGVLLENFPICKELLIPPGTQNYMVRMRLYDVNKRLLNLTIRIVCRAEGSLKILISAPYWLINKTGKFCCTHEVGNKDFL